MLNRLRSPLFPVLAFALTAAIASAQTLERTTAKVRFQEANGHSLPASMFIVRGADGAEVAPVQEPYGAFSFKDVGRKVTFEFTGKYPKSKGVELVLEDAPIVFVTLAIDPNTGKIKQLTQKPMRPHLQRGTVKQKQKREGTGQIIALLPPANDACANALPIFDGVTAFSTIGATTDGAPHVTGDPNFCQYDGQTYEDIWYIYTPTCNGTLTVSTCGTASYDTDLAIYEADTDGDGDHDILDCANITTGVEDPIACNDDAGICAGFTSVASTPVVADHRYIIRIGGFGPGDEGSGSVLISCGGAPSNDICTAPRDLTCGTSLQVTNIAATTAITDPPFSCAFGGPAQGDGTLWFRFTATSTSAFLSTSSSIGVTDTLLAVYSGTCGSLTELECDDDSGTGLLSELCVKGLTIGNSYLVQVASYPGAATGRITIELECPGPCEVACDECETACPIPCGDSMTVDNTNAGTDPLDPAFSCRFGGAGQGVGTLWFTFVATATSAKIDTNDSSAFDTLLAVYSGTCGSFTELGCSDDEGVGLLSELCVEGLTIGQTYYIQAASYSSFDTGEITVTVECPCAPGFPNDECETAIALGPLPASVTVDISDATDDITDPCGVFSGPFFNVWYTVVGTGNTLTATTCNAGTQVDDTKIAVYCLDCATPVCVGGNDDQQPFGSCGFNVFDSTVSWCSQAGATYFITVGTFSPFDAPGIVQLDVFDTGLGCVADIQCFATGACCLAGACSVTTEADCAAQGGTYQGDNTACTANAIADGGYEAGPFGGIWTESSTNFGTPICDAGCGFGGGTGPRSGDFWSWFGGIGAFEEGSTSQNVTIPLGATTLDFFLEIPVSSGNGFDFLEVEIDGTQVFLTMESDGPFIGYIPVSVPLGAFADGGVHLVDFHSVISGVGGTSNFFVDDISILTVALECPTCVTFDFETDDTGNSMPHGAKVDTEFDCIGTTFPMTITGSVNLSGANSVAILNSTTGPASQDPDLLVTRGNILILQTDANLTQCPPASGVYCTHNDDENGGLIRFSLCVPASPSSLVLVDIDGTDPASSVVLTDVNGKTRTFAVPGNWTGDKVTNFPAPGWGTLDLTTLANQPGFASTVTASEQAGFDPSAVVTIDVHLGGSGGVDDLTICQ